MQKSNFCFTITNNVLKCRIRLAEWRASRGKVMKRPPISVVLETRLKSEEQEFSSAGGSLDHVLHSEKVNKTLVECLQLSEQVFNLLPTNSICIGPCSMKILWMG